MRPLAIFSQVQAQRLIQPGSIRLSISVAGSEDFLLVREEDQVVVLREQRSATSDAALGSSAPPLTERKHNAFTAFRVRLSYAGEAFMLMEGPSF